MNKTKNQAVKVPKDCIQVSKRSLLYQNHFLKLRPNEYEVFYEDSKQVIFKVNKDTLETLKNVIESSIDQSKHLLMCGIAHILKTGDKNRITKAIDVLNRLSKI